MSAQPYRHLDAALIRATTYAGETDLPPWPGLDGDADEWREWIVQVWANQSVASAVSMASPVLAARVEAVRAGRRLSPARLWRMALSLARYLVRMRGRATPFGTFAGVAPLRFTTEPGHRTGGGHTGVAAGPDTRATTEALTGPDTEAITGTNLGSDTERATGANPGADTEVAGANPGADTEVVTGANPGMDSAMVAGVDPGTAVTRTTADGVWLAAMIARLESCPALLRRLPVVVNDLAFVRGERLVAPWRPHAADPARGDPVEVSVRHGLVVRAVMDLAQEPVPAGDLIDALADAFPRATVPAIEAMVGELVASGVLITSLRPPSTSIDGLAHVSDRLRDLADATPGEIAPLADELRAIHAALRAADRTTGEPAQQARRAASDRMRSALQPGIPQPANASEPVGATGSPDVAQSAGAAGAAGAAGLVGGAHPDGGTRSSGVAQVVEVAQPLMVDLRLGGVVGLPVEVAAEVEAAAGALLRLTPHPGGHPAWRAYHVGFLERYGDGAVVPIEQLIDSTAGLGFPEHYGETRRQAWQQGAPASLPLRDQRLLVMAQQAALDGAREIVLDDAAIDDLAADGSEGARAAPYMELVAEVCATDTEALAAGAFSLAELAVNGTAGGVAGRFVDLLPDGDRRRMAALYGRLPVGVERAVTAQLSFPARHPRAQEVGRTPLLLPELITLAEHRDGPGGRIRWRELAVTADNDRMYLLSPSRRQVVEPALTSAVARQAMPPLARLLFELPRARAAMVAPFSWGAAVCLPYLPRIRYGRSVLAPARWRIATGTLPGPDAAWPEWVRAMTDLRAHLRLPAHVSVGTADLRLRLDLDEPMSLALLRAHLDGAGGSAVVSEAAGRVGHGWFGGRAHEIVVPLTATRPPVRAPAAVTAPGPLPLIGREHAVLPGSRVLSAKLYGHPAVVDTILTGCLADLLESWDDDPPMWWFVRYADPRPHLRLRLHLADGDYGTAAARVGAWASGLRGRGLIGDLVLDTYHPETARYGPAEVLAAAEAVFAADSVAVLAQLATLSADRRVHPHALTAASLVDLTAAMAGGPAAGARWHIDHREGERREAGQRGAGQGGIGRVSGGDPAVARQTVRQTVGLADPGEDRAALRDLPGGPRIVAAWQDRRRAVAAYMDRLATVPYLTRSSVMASFLHMHHLRALGIDPDTERACRKLARAAALAFTARHTPPRRD
ncbi:thiopeptide-type bacteriocin biosynthesis domain-containing protein [Nonomuraea solani]|uniref:Thiopeptide-type bacteriocin biosynthesis domain-containing protein n=1 Tax=Nonomuraea solani TaxID=1144553 RepID=A0A1H5XUQ5_9ACTN|nr:lantibiotic dehydratase [Nonomuraea solani]SEG15383.1 thiopeptide-type bacteriocin biosynthesis domain-containing protein [Nonomuraea solani]